MTTTPSVAPKPLPLNGRGGSGVTLGVTADVGLSAKKDSEKDKDKFEPASPAEPRAKVGEAPAPQPEPPPNPNPPWTPTKKDIAAMEKAIAVAQLDKLDQDEEWEVEQFFTGPSEEVEAPPTQMYKRLLKEIEGAKTIRASLYGMDMVPEVMEALKKAKAAGADIQIVVDQQGDGTFQYPQTKDLIEALGPKCVRVEQGSITGIMHNKFWVFDEARVWTGSANINQSAIRNGYNFEAAILLHSRNAAKVYRAEHAQMWAGRFHGDKVDATPTQLPTTPSGKKLRIFFSPKQQALKDGIIPLIDKATERIDLALFHFSDSETTDALIRAHLERNVKVRVLVDASGAANEFTMANIEKMWAAGIHVQVEIWGGKQHAKGGRIDNHVVHGSMNWSQSGATKNDENTILFESDEPNPMADAYGKEIDRLLKELPALTRFYAFAPEGLVSINSLFDGMDNDHNGSKDPALTRNDFDWTMKDIDEAGERMAKALPKAEVDEALLAVERIVLSELRKVKKRLEEPESGETRKLIAELEKIVLERAEKRKPRKAA